MQAYIYARFSSLEQAKGTSLERQLQDCRAFCDSNGWDRSPLRELVDEGRSAFDGTNRAFGSELAAFEQQVRQGALPAETALVVERLDRLSRQSAADVFMLIKSLTEAGVTVATVDGGRLYTCGSFDLAHTMELLVKAHVAFEESEKKSHRIAAAWAIKRARAAQGELSALTRRCPAWIAVDESTKRYTLIEGRAAVIRRIFDLTICGHGKHMIASTLNREMVPTWGRGKSGWQPSYIQKIISSRTVVGDYQPYTKSKGKRTIAGGPVRGIYPSVIDEATYARAHAARAGRSNGAGRKTRSFNNLLSGLVKCNACGSTMTFRNKGKPGEQYLVCDNALRHHGCSYRTHFNYAALEAAVIDQTLHLALDDTHFSAPETVARLDAERAKQQVVVDDLSKKQRRLVKILADYDNMAEAELQLREAVVDAAAAKEELSIIERNLLVARGQVSPLENVRRIRKMIAALSSSDEEERAIARGTVQQAIRSLIEGICCDPISRMSRVRAGKLSFGVKRDGAVVHEVRSRNIGVSTLIELRESGYVINGYKSHPAFGVEQPKDDGVV